MSLQRIYSSKLYVTSTRKDRIHAAMQDPINAELVQQLEEYLSDEAKIELKRAENQNNATSGAAAVPETEGAPSSHVGSSHSAPPSGGAPSSFTGDIMSDFGEDELADIDIPEDSEDLGESFDEAPVVEEDPEQLED